MMISSSDKATDYRKAPLEGTIVSELGGAPSTAPVGGGADRTEAFIPENGWQCVPLALIHI